jgi:hypothetical protein
MDDTVSPTGGQASRPTQGPGPFHYVLAVILGIVTAAVDLHASEVQPTLAVLATGGALLGLCAPRGAWKRALVMGLILPLAQVGALALGLQASAATHPYLSRLLIAVPSTAFALAGAAVGASVRLVIASVRARSA